MGEAATIAGLPVAPSAYNPIVNPTRATMRRNYVLRRMYDLGRIDELTYQTEKSLPMEVRRAVEPNAVKTSERADSDVSQLTMPPNSPVCWFMTSSAMKPTRGV